MIKKNLKTLSDIQHPTKKKWRIHLEDGSFIDVENEIVRDETILRLYGNGHFLSGNVHVTPLAGPQYINLDFQVTATGTAEHTPTENQSRGRKFWKMFKKDVLFWDKATFIYLTLLATIVGSVSYILKYLLGGPIKSGPTMEIPFLEGGMYWLGFTLLFVGAVSQVTRVLNLLGYVMCFTKFISFLVFSTLLILTLGHFNDSLVDKIGSFIAKHMFTEKENKIIKTIIED